MKILVINCGSSSCKFQLFETSTGDVLAKGNAERIGIDGKLTYKAPGKEDFIWPIFPRSRQPVTAYSTAVSITASPLS